MRIVKGWGNDDQPPLAVVGERPGRIENMRGEPFVGPTGKIQDALIHEFFGLGRRANYYTNLDKSYAEDNPDPTPESIAHWGPKLIEELKFVQPRAILAVGAFATRYLTGGMDLDAVHGKPQHCPHIPGPVVLPVYHPANLLHEATMFSPRVRWDYEHAAHHFREDSQPVEDAYPDPVYVDMEHSDQLKDMLHGEPVAALDTEEDIWSFQISISPGLSLVVRKERDPRMFAAALQVFRVWLRDTAETLVIHNAPYDVEIMQHCKVDLLDPGVRIFDSMMAAYLLRVEPQGLKNGSRRHLGMEMLEYEDLIGPVEREKQIDYLIGAYEEGEWPESETFVVRENDGIIRPYKPQALNTRLEKIIADVMDEDKRSDPKERWGKLHESQRRVIEERLGPFPKAGLGDIDLDTAIYYAGRDTDAAIRLRPIYEDLLEQNGQSALMDLKMRMLPAVIEMRMNGFLADKDHFENLRDHMWEQMDGIREDMVAEYCEGWPEFYDKRDGQYHFNPASQPQVNWVMRQFKWKTAKRTKTVNKKTGERLFSTAKKYTDPLKGDIPFFMQMAEWREHQKVKDSFCEPIIRLFPDGVDRLRICCDIKTTRVSSGRFSASDPNLMAIPVRSELGLRVRAGFRAEDGWTLGTWDTDQAEMREMADQSRDQRMVDIFTGKIRAPRGEVIDYHTDTAARNFGVDYYEVDKMAHRYPAKRAGFGTITGIGDQGLLDQLLMAGCKRADGSSWTKPQVAELRRNWFKLHPGVKAYLKECRDKCRDNGGVIYTRGGMPCYLPNIFSNDHVKKSEAERQSHSHMIQGGAQEGLQRAMAWLYPVIRKTFNRHKERVRWILQIHDELIMECVKDPILTKELDAVMVEGITKHGPSVQFETDIPVNSKGGFGETWDLLEH